MMTRKEYLDGYSVGEEGRLLHRRYYAQFVTETIREIVANYFGASIRTSTDPHFNDIPLGRWDYLVSHLSPVTSVHAQLSAAGDYMTLANGVCILKEAAEQIREEGSPS